MTKLPTRKSIGRFIATVDEVYGRNPAGAHNDKGIAVLRAFSVGELMSGLEAKWRAIRVLAEFDMDSDKKLRLSELITFALDEPVLDALTEEER